METPIDPILVHVGRHGNRYFQVVLWNLPPNVKHTLKLTTDFINFTTYREFPASAVESGEGFTMFSAGKMPVMFQG